MARQQQPQTTRSPKARQAAAAPTRGRRQAEEAPAQKRRVRQQAEEAPARRRRAVEEEAPAPKRGRRQAEEAPAQKRRVRQQAEEAPAPKRGRRQQAEPESNWTIKVAYQATLVLDANSVEIGETSATFQHNGAIRMVPIEDVLVASGESVVVSVSNILVLTASEVESKNGRLILDGGEGIIRTDRPGTTVSIISGEEESDADGKGNDGDFDEGGDDAGDDFDGGDDFDEGGDDAGDDFDGGDDFDEGDDAGDDFDEGGDDAGDDFDGGDDFSDDFE